MAKLYFRYGTVCSAKTLNLLAVAHNYRQQGKEVVLMRPQMDVRFGLDNIKSRAGLEMTADVLIDERTDLLSKNYEGISCILVDEAQFLSKKIIDDLRDITLLCNIPVICYGLRTDFQGNLFEGSKRLMEMADAIEEVKSTCYYCNKKSVMNVRYVDRVPVRKGPTILLGTEDVYLPACYGCFAKEMKKAEEAELSLV